MMKNSLWDKNRDCCYRPLCPILYTLSITSLGVPGLRDSSTAGWFPLRFHTELSFYMKFTLILNLWALQPLVSPTINSKWVLSAATPLKTCSFHCSGMVAPSITATLNPFSL